MLNGIGLIERQKDYDVDVSISFGNHKRTRNSKTFVIFKYNHRILMFVFNQTLKMLVQTKYLAYWPSTTLLRNSYQ